MSSASPGDFHTRRSGSPSQLSPPKRPKSSPAPAPLRCRHVSANSLPGLARRDLTVCIALPLGDGDWLCALCRQPPHRGWSLAPPLAAGLAVSQFTPEIPFPRRSRSVDQTREAGTRRQRRRGRLHRACQAAHAAGEGRPADRPTGRWLCAELGAGVGGLRAGRVHSPPLFHSISLFERRAP